MSMNDNIDRAARLEGGSLVPVGYQQITSLGSSTALTVPTGARVVIISPEDQQVRWRDDGGSLTTTVGMVIGVDDYFIYTGDLSAIRFIEEAASAKLNISYYG